MDAGITGSPGLGPSHTSDWTIEGGHFAERCQAFILIALGESIVIIGATLSGEKSVRAAGVAAFIVAFAGSVALWWVYFDQSAGAAAEVIARSSDPGRLGRSAYHFIHPLMVAGIVVSAAADEKILSSPSVTATTASAWMILGGPALFLAGHAAFKFVIWGSVPWTRLAGIAVLALLALAARTVPELALAACAASASSASPSPIACPGCRTPKPESAKQQMRKGFGMLQRGLARAAAVVMMRAVCLAMLQLGPGNPHGVHRYAPRLDVTARARTAGRVAAPTS